MTAIFNKESRKNPTSKLILDKVVLQKLTAIDSDGELITQFRLQSMMNFQEKLKEIEALELTDWSETCRVVHSIKSSLAYLGAGKVGEFCEAIERMNPPSHLGEWEAIFSTLQIRIEEWKRELDVYVDSISRKQNV